MPTSEPHSPELLAPAGGADSLRAAVANGADAVYLGLDVLNARRAAENFTIDSLPDACKFAHLNGVRVYLTANVLVLPAELEEALRIVDRAWEAGVDAVIVQDIGLLRAVRSSLPHVRVHASTQMNAHNAPTIRTLAGLGVSRVTLAREVSLEEIGGFVAGGGGVEVESFVHGALCVCYSGQCLMSSLIGRRSANRGMCAQPCRLPYELVDEAGEILGTPGAHLLSPKDLAGISVLPELVASGVAALKIEGRMKSPEYVALVTGVYRAALDRALSHTEGYEVRDGERAVLEESFSRGFSEAYLLGERGNDMMSYRRPNNRGVPVGRVAAVDAGRATISLDAPVDAEDTIEFWTSSGRFAQPVGRLEYAGGRHAAAPAGVRASIALEGNAGVGDRVFRVRNAALSAAAKRTFESADDGAGSPLDFTVRVVVGEPLQVEVCDRHDRRGIAQGVLVEGARTKAVTAEEIAEHIGRLGGTPYSVRGWDLALSPNAGIGFSALHRVRRDAIEAYESGLLAPWSGRKLANPRLPRLRRSARTASTPTLVAALTDDRLARACLAAGVDAVHVPVQALASVRDLPNGAVPLLPRIAHDREVGRLLSFAQPNERVVVGNLGLLRPAADLGAVVEAHWSLNALNPLSIEQLADLGASFVWLSPELSGRQMAECAQDAVVPVGAAVYGRQEIMVTEHCILMAEGDCSRRCGSCARRASRRVLRDRKGYEFPVITDVTGRSHVFNSVPLDLTGALSELLATGVSALRIDLTIETAQEAGSIVRRVRQTMGMALADIETPKKDGTRQTTSGHFFRGVL